MCAITVIPPTHQANPGASPAARLLGIFNLPPVKIVVLLLNKQKNFAQIAGIPYKLEKCDDSNSS
jgi:hypothetical protein